MSKSRQVLEEIKKSLEDIEIRLQYSQHTSFPVNVRELDGSISQQRPKTNEGHAYDLTKETLEKINKLLENTDD